MFKERCITAALISRRSSSVIIGLVGQALSVLFSGELLQCSAPRQPSVEPGSRQQAQSVSLAFLHAGWPQRLPFAVGAVGQQ